MKEWPILLRNMSITSPVSLVGPNFVGFMLIIIIGLIIIKIWLIQVVKPENLCTRQRSVNDAI